MISYAYDLKVFQLLILGSDLYQSGISLPIEGLEEGPNYHSSPILRRLKAEQIYDSILTLLSPNLDKVTKNSYKFQNFYENYKKINAMSQSQFIQYVKDNSSKNLRGLMQMSGYNSGKNDMQSIFKNIAKTRQGRKDIENYKKANQQIKILHKKYKGKKNRKKMTAADWEPFKKHQKIKNDFNKKYNIKRPKFKRASEPGFSAKPGSFIRDFGGSDRETIEAGNLNPSITQMLFLINGQRDTGRRGIWQKNGLIFQKIKKLTTAKQKVNYIFKAILSRLPTEAEKEMIITDIKNNSVKATEDLIWILLNAREFIFPI